ncbi:MAG: tRNA (guanosine(46)-N7)-methyltransferase TrmB [Anaerolineales bacterium]
MSRGRQIARLKLKPLAPVVLNRYLLDWPAADLHSHPGSFSDLTSENLFGNSRPLQVEIGAGSGEYLCHLAAEAPGANFLGIEISRRAALSTVSLAAEQRLENVLVLRADFKLLYPLLPEKGWQVVYLHFPDPPEKQKDAKRQIFTAAFLDKMARVLAAEGTLSLVSDKREYFFAMLELAEKHQAFELAHPQRYLAGFEPSVKSRFQRFWEAKGVLPLRFVLRTAQF